MDYTAFARGHAAHRPCVAEGAAVRQINNAMLRAAADAATVRIRSLTPTQALQFLHAAAARMDGEGSLAELVNERPEVALVQYDDSRLNVKIDLTLLEVAEAVHRCRPVATHQDAAAFALLAAKLRVVRRLRVQMWEFHQLQRGLAAAPDDGDEAKDRQRALLRLLLNLRIDNAHKRLDQVCYEHVHDGQPTGYFRRHRSIKDYV